jgi:hypothetical protein
VLGEPPAPYVPFDGLEPDPGAGPREPWYPVFLCELATRGLMGLAAARAGVHRSTVYRRRDANPDFADEIEVAREYYRDYLEWESVTLGRVKGNPLPYFARLKAERPGRYIDKQAVLVAGVAELSSEEGKALLQGMLRSAGETTHQALTARGAPPDLVLDGEPAGPATPDASA